jgi:hypothetical protein
VLVLEMHSLILDLNSVACAHNFMPLPVKMAPASDDSPGGKCSCFSCVIQPLDGGVSPLFAVEPVTIDHYSEKKDTQ